MTMRVPESLKKMAVPLVITGTVVAGIAGTVSDRFNVILKGGIESENDSMAELKGVVEQGGGTSYTLHKIRRGLIDNSYSMDEDEESFLVWLETIQNIESHPLKKEIFMYLTDEKNGRSAQQRMKWCNEGIALCTGNNERVPLSALHKRAMNIHIENGDYPAAFVSADASDRVVDDMVEAEGSETMESYKTVLDEMVSRQAVSRFGPDGEQEAQLTEDEIQKAVRVYLHYIAQRPSYNLTQLAELLYQLGEGSEELYAELWAVAHLSEQAEHAGGYNSCNDAINQAVANALQSTPPDYSAFTGLAQRIEKARGTELVADADAK